MAGGKKGKASRKYSLDAEVQVIDGEPVIKVETKEGYTSYQFPWPEVAVVDGKEVALERQGNYFLLPTADGNEKVSIEEFQVALVAGQLMLLTSVNPWWTVPVAVATAALIAARVAITAATLKAATLLIAAGKSVTARTVHVVVSSWPTIRTALTWVGITATTTAVTSATWDWIQGNCIVSGRRTPDGHFGDMLCSTCALRFRRQFFGLRP